MKGFDYRIAARPTTYKGVNYRSKLEATYGAYFSLSGWNPEYEPCDLGTWTPDFRLIVTGTPVLVEIKPIRCEDLYAEYEKLGYNLSEEWDSARRDYGRTEKFCFLFGETPDFCWVMHKGFADEFWNHDTEIMIAFARRRFSTTWLAAKNEVQWVPK